jgi:hypothetical protein
MTAMTGVPAPQTGMASPRTATRSNDRAPDAGQPGKDAGRTEKTEGFDSLFSRMGAEKGAPAQTPQPAAGNEGKIQPVRPRDTRAKPLQAEEALAAELLLAFMPQQAAAPVPLPQPMTMALAAATVLPGLPQGEVSTELPPALPDPVGQSAPDGAASALMMASIAPAMPGPLAPLPAAIQPIAQEAAAALAAISTPARLQDPSLLAAAMAQGQSGPAAMQPKDAPLSPRQNAPRVSEADLASFGIGAMEADPESLDALGRKPVASPERIGEMAVTVTRQETILPPASQTPAIQQTADRIMGELASMAEEFAPAEKAGSRRESELAPVRVLHIQLDPPDLGVLTVKLALRDNALSIQVAAAEPGTARLIERDRERLTDMLRSAGYGMDGVTIQVAAPSERSHTAFHNMMGAGGDSSAQSGYGAQSQAGGAQADAQRGHQSRRGNDEWQGSAPGRSGGENASAPGPAADGDLYI